MTAAPSLIPFRWVGYGRDLRTIIDDPLGPLFVAADVCEALEIDVPTETKDWRKGTVLYSYPGNTTFRDDVVDEHGEPLHLYAANQVRSVAADHPEYFTAMFLSWFDELLAEIATHHRGLRRASRPEEPAAPELAAGRTYSVRRAARILSRDPALEYGLHTLFAGMRRLGWVSKEHDIWVPAEASLQAGHLVRQKVHVPGRREHYPQVRLTREGLAALHKQLGGVAQLDLDTPEPSPLSLEIS